MLPLHIVPPGQSSTMSVAECVGLGNVSKLVQVNIYVLGTAVTELNGSAFTFTHRKKKMVPLFMGILYVVPCSNTGIFCRKSTGAFY